MFRPSASVDCFYCQSDITPPPRNPRNFRCTHCQCWNRYDSAGEILSDEPAMHDPDLNSRSFARRASPRKDRFLSNYGNTVFCRTCQTNQMLLTNLLSNYLPPSDDSDYEKRLEMLPEYQVSIQQRYPPVCSSCLPAVEEEIRNRNHMARTNVLGRWLKQSRRKQKHTASTIEGLIKFDRDLKVWKLRGVLWGLSYLISIICNTTVFCFGYQISPTAIIPTRVLPVMAAILFPLVCLWNPMGASFKRAKHQRRDLRLQGRTTYIVCQLIIWLLRFLTCAMLFLSSFGPQWDYLHLMVDEPSSQSRFYFSISLMLELSLLILSLYVLRLHTPPGIRLIDPNGRDSSMQKAPTEHSEAVFVPNVPSQELDHLASLTLSTTPIIRTNPVFGTPSLHHPPQAQQLDDPDAMDWTPTNPSPKRGPFSQDYEDDSFVKPQQFFPPEEATGLERLLAHTNLETTGTSRSTSPVRTSLKDLNWSRWLYTLLFIPVVAMVYYRLWVYH